MNQRIDELMIQAGARFEFLHGVHYDDFQYRKFAELIVRDVVEQIITRERTDGEWYQTDIFKYFGVEE